MANSEKIISPGVFTNELDQSFLPAAVGDIGAAVIGPTVKGPAMIPTVVSSMSEFSQIFGEVLISGSSKQTYLTSELARNYLKNGNKLTVVRILDGEFTNASTDVVTESDPTTSLFASASIFVRSNPTGSVAASGSFDDEVKIGGVDFTFVSTSVGLSNSATQIFVPFGIGNANTDRGGFIASASVNLRDAINNSSSLHGLDITAAIHGATAISGTVVVTSSIAGTSGNGITVATGSYTADHDTFGFANQGGTAIVHNDITSGPVSTFLGGVDGDAIKSFKLHTHAVGSIMNSSGSDADTKNGEKGLLKSGSNNNIRWEIPSKNNKKGTFNLLVRRGDDTTSQKQILETWNNVSLDPNAGNYISKVIGDTKQVLSSPGTPDVHIANSGSHLAKSKYVRVEVLTPLIDYLNENGVIRENSLSSSLPATGSGSYGGAFIGGNDGWTGYDSLGNANGTAGHAVTASFNENIDNDDSQGFVLQTANKGKTAYEDAINLLSNQDEYDINLLFMPGVVDNFANHQAIVTKAIDMVEDRGDVFLVVDPTGYNSSPTAATGRAEARNSSYTSMYYPWQKVVSPVLGKSIWVPPSVGVAGVYSFNDKVSHTWFAPAGLNRGVLDSSIDTERQLLRGQRDKLYESNVNPITRFPGQGVVVFGQKTLQKKASALDRVNVRRLLIQLKKFFASTSRFLVFEQNNSKTRNRFLNIVNPYMEQVQSNSGVNVFKVVMDETNNTPDVVDRNQLVGQIIIQPTKTAEFIVLDFNIQSTGAAFPE